MPPASPATSRSSPRPARWARRRSPPRSSPSTRTSTPRRSAATSPASASSASAAWATTSTRSSPRSARSCGPRGQHNIALFGAGHLGKAIASSDIFADHGFRVVAIFDPDPEKIGEKVGTASVRHPDDLKQIVEEEDIVVGVLAVPTAAAQPLADQLVDAGVKIIFNYSEALLQVPPEVTVHTSSPAVDLLYALYFYLT